MSDELLGSEASLHHCSGVCITAIGDKLRTAGSMISVAAPIRARDRGREMDIDLNEAVALGFHTGSSSRKGIGMSVLASDPFRRHDASDITASNAKRCLGRMRRDPTALTLTFALVPHSRAAIADCVLQFRSLHLKGNRCHSYNHETDGTQETIRFGRRRGTNCPNRLIVNWKCEFRPLTT